MKKYLLSLSFLVLSGFCFSQGLENIIVEKYYISDANDALANADGGILPVGSVTYRIYADMLPDYRFQAVYGISTHEMRIETSTLFFNNEDRGATSPTYSKTQARNNTVMLDSWLSVGAACTGNFGILKADDDGVSTVVNSFSPLVLQNNDPAAGIPVSLQDGLIAGTPEAVTTLGIATEMSVFDNQNDGTNGPLFSTFNGSWASLNGSTGPTIDNRVLLAQITTDGTFSFELNIQIGTPTGGVENYVAKNATGNEIQLPSLTYNSSTVGLTNHTVTEAKINAYPNPVNDFITIELPELKNNKAGSYSLYDARGVMLMNKEFKSASAKKESIDISAFADGLYIIQVFANGSLSEKRIIKN